MSANKSLLNPFKPGAGHMPPYLAGREKEKQEFLKLLDQKTVLCNLILTGLRGVGKTVLLDTFKPLAFQKGWLWVGTDLSESASVSEEATAQRLLADLSVVTAGVKIRKNLPPVGFQAQGNFEERNLNFVTLVEIYKSTPGLVSDKLKALLQIVWDCLTPHNVKGVVFAYDEAQTMTNHDKKEQYPLSLLLDVFQSIQKKNIPFMLVLVGLPTLFPKLVEARTFSERMFDILMLNRLNDVDSREAILKPIKECKSDLGFDDKSIKLIYETSGGYPYFIQFICKELFDIWAQHIALDGKAKPIPMAEITQKLDKDFFSGRWARATDRQRDLLSIIATLDNSDGEFTVQEIVTAAKRMASPFGSSQVNQMLLHLTNTGLIYKNRHGKYAFAVPLLGGFILRQEAERTKPLFT
ncbi:MAG TPA: ATP-binding protein [Verrucomicrobiae bacterium]|nr:ATP-binding protein [Verrucomicrobiae bacterium]